MVSRKNYDPAEGLAEIRAIIKSQLFNILAANPLLPRFYEEAARSFLANPTETKNLAENNLNFRGPDQVPVNSPLIKNVRHCTHIKVTGVRCGSPAMREEQFCYFHQRMLRGVKTPPNVRLHPIALIEDEEAIQASLMEVINALARNHIDLRRADLILKALLIAVKNSRRARFNVNDNQMVREVPDYPAPPAPASLPIPAEKALPRLVAQDMVARVRAAALMTIGAPAALGAAAGATRARSARETAAAVRPQLQAEATSFAIENAPPDPTLRKPPARAGIPSTTKQAVVNQHKTRT